MNIFEALSFSAVLLSILIAIDTMATDELKKNYSNWLRRSSEYSPDLFSNTLDKFFGDTIFSWKSFRFSILLSICALILIAIGTLILSPNLFVSAFGTHYGFWLWSTLILAICINCIGDYLSYAQTRLFIKAIGSRSDTTTKVIFALSDIVASLAIFVLTFSLFSTLALIAAVHGSKSEVNFLTFGVINEAVKDHDWDTYGHSHSFASIAVSRSSPVQSLASADGPKLEAITSDFFDEALGQEPFYNLFRLQNHVDFFKPDYVRMRVNERCAALISSQWDAALNDSNGQLNERAEIEGEGDYISDTASLFSPSFEAFEDYETHSKQTDANYQSARDILLKTIETYNSDPLNPPCVPVTDFQFSFDMHALVAPSDFTEIYHYFVFDTSVFLFRSNYLGYKNFDSFDLNTAIPDFAATTKSKRWGLENPDSSDDRSSLEVWLLQSYKKKIQKNYPDVRIPESTLAATALVPSIFFLISVALRILSYLTLLFGRIAPTLNRKFDLRAHPFIATALCLSAFLCLISLLL